MAHPEVRVTSWVRASDSDIKSGLLGFVAVEYGNLALDSIVIRRTAGGRLCLAFPARTDRAGRRHAYIRPVDDGARREIERQILDQLGQRENASAEATDG